MANEFSEIEHRLTRMETTYESLNSTLKELTESVKCLRECAIEFKFALKNQREEHLRDLRDAKQSAAEALKKAESLDLKTDALNAKLTWWENKRAQFVGLVAIVTFIMPIFSGKVIDWISNVTTHLK